MKKSLLYILLGLLSIAPIAASAQDISGQWIGKLTQNEGGFVVDYLIRFEFAQHGKRVLGSSYVSIPNKPELFAEMSVDGVIENGVFRFQEMGVTKQEMIMQWEWCVKAGELKLDTIGGNIWRLEGPWRGGALTPDCPPGDIIVEREIIVEEKGPEEIKDPDFVVADPFVPMDTFPVIEEPRIAGRKVVADQEAEVSVREVKIAVWDSDVIDGDVISLYYNGVWILENYKLNRKKKEITLLLDPAQENILALFAQNTGRFPPNTAALTFWDGKKNQQMELKSDMEQCGAIQFTYKK